MNKMSKKTSCSENSKIKQEIKEESKDFDPAVYARDRLKGALQDLQALQSDNSTDSDDCRMKNYSYKKNERERGIPKKKKHKLGAVKETPFQHTFVMKLFDRSVDLAQFEENTPLYPICRAWMANNPRSFINSKVNNKESVKKIKKEDRREKDKKFKIDDAVLKEVCSLPSPLPMENEKNLSSNIQISLKQEFEFPSENDKNLPARDVLLASHITHWGEIKKKMRADAFRKEKRFEPSKKILKRIFHGAQ